MKCYIAVCIYLLLACWRTNADTSSQSGASHQLEASDGSGYDEEEIVVTVEEASGLEEKEEEGENEKPENEIYIPRSVDEELINSISIHGSSYHEGDIRLTEQQRSQIEGQTGEPEDPTEPQKAVSTSQNKLWPQGRVPYTISSALGSRGKSAILAAMNEYSKHTCIEFVRRTDQSDYLYFFKGSGCWSFVGKVGRRQDISIGEGCEYKGIVMHEVFHALGRWHEQSRPDRDRYVRIKTENIQSDLESNFFKYSVGQVSTQGLPYDYRSIMHYSAYAFSRNGNPTIVPTDRRVSLGSLGQRSGFSSTDIKHINSLYCSSSSSGSWSGWSSWSSCSRSCNGGTRTRTRRCVGGDSCRGNNIDTQSCNTQSCGAPPTWSQWSTWSGCSVSCGGGRQSRTRRCWNGNTCSGPATVYRNCNTQQCPPPTGTWSKWSQWSRCSSSCGGGEQIKTRSCRSPPCTGAPKKTKKCNTNKCPRVPFVRGLKYKGCYKVLTDSGIYLLDGRSAVLSTESASTRKNPVGKCAQAAMDFSFTVMAVAAGYCISGNNDLAAYTKQPAWQCSNGQGAYDDDSGFFMDVYSIAKPSLFSNPTADVVLRDAVTNEQGHPHNSGSISLSPSSLTVGLMMVATLFHVLMNYL